MSGTMRHRCPKNGRFVGEWGCMACNDPPPDGEGGYDVCWSYNVVNPDLEAEGKIVPRWDSKWRDRRSMEATD